jgi:methylthioribose-1-phosphate isomerase
MSSFKTIEWKDGAVRMLDQRLLPLEEVYVDCRTYEDVAISIKEMVIRGAPAIGVAAAMGVALGACAYSGRDRDGFMKHMAGVFSTLSSTRPTAVNLFWALKRMNRVISMHSGKPVSEIKDLLVAEALEIFEEDVRVCREIGKNGARLIEDGMTVMTHCNAGALATAAYGTALGVIRAAIEEGKRVSVVANETRPFLQGARLTAWELKKDGIPVTLITDNMAGYVMRKGMVDAVVVGADRIAANGDVANKIGTYSLSILAKAHSVPFYVAAPLSTVDLACRSGDSIPIEERDPGEVTHVQGKRVAPEVGVLNPAFDVTPNENVSLIITEKGILESPLESSIALIASKDL